MDHFKNHLKCLSSPVGPVLLFIVLSLCIFNQQNGRGDEVLVATDVILLVRAVQVSRGAFDSTTVLQGPGAQMSQHTYNSFCLVVFPVHLFVQSLVPNYNGI